MKKETGFSAVELILAAVAVAVIGLVGYKVYTLKHQPAPTPVAVKTKPMVPAAPEVKKASDLTTAEKTLDSVDVDANTTDASQLNSQVASF